MFDDAPPAATNAAAAAADDAASAPDAHAAGATAAPPAPPTEPRSRARSDEAQLLERLGKLGHAHDQLLTGERRAMELPSCSLITYMGTAIAGRLLMTNYQLIFVPTLGPSSGGSGEQRAAHPPAASAQAARLCRGGSCKKGRHHAASAGLCRGEQGRCGAPGRGGGRKQCCCCNNGRSHGWWWWWRERP